MASSGSAGLTLRQAALIAGFAYLLDPVSYAEFTLWPQLIGTTANQTAANLATHHGLLIGVFFSFFVNFIEDIVIAWALYFLLAPVNKALSLLASLFQLVYAAICLVGLFNLLPAYRAAAPPFLVDLLLHWFRYDYSMALVLFAIHLVLAGYLIFRSTYVPRWLGLILIIDGLGWILTCLQPYLYPAANLGFLNVTELGELVFMVWLLLMGWRIKEPVTLRG
jgi:Domain of unknown function (DUF4386)